MKFLTILISGILLTSVNSLADRGRNGPPKNVATFSAASYCSDCADKKTKREVRDDAIAKAQDKGIYWCNSLGANGVRFYGTKTRVTATVDYRMYTATVTAYCVFRN